MELFSHARLAFNPRISPTSCAAVVPSASAVSIVFLPPRCSRSATCSRWTTCLPVHVKRQTASPTLLFPLWHPVSPSTMRCRPARQRSTLYSCRLASSSRCAHAEPLRAADGPASSPCVSRGCRPPACNPCCRRTLLRSSTAITTLPSLIGRRSPRSSPCASATPCSYGSQNLKTIASSCGRSSSTTPWNRSHSGRTKCRRISSSAASALSSRPSPSETERTPPSSAKRKHPRKRCHPELVEEPALSVSKGTWSWPAHPQNQL